MEEQQKELDGKWLQEGVQRMMVMLESDSRNESFARVCVASFMTRMNPTVAETDDVKTALKMSKKQWSQCTVNLYAERSVLEWVFALWKHLWMI